MSRVILALVLFTAVTSQELFQTNEDAACNAKLSAMRLVNKMSLEEIQILQKKVIECENDDEAEIQALLNKVAECESEERTAIPTKDSETVQKGPVSKSCKTRCHGGCFWVDVRTAYSLSYADAEKVCENYDSVMAVIPDEATFYDVIELSQEVASGRFKRFNVWTGMTVRDSNASNADPQYAFYKWYPEYPTQDPKSTRIALHVVSGPVANYQGIFNLEPDAKRDGVICWKPLFGKEFTSQDPKTKIHRGSVSNSCRDTCKGGCFWIEVRSSSSDFTFAAAERVCEAQDSVVAVIPDEKTYNDIVWNARLLAVSKWNTFNVWTAMKLTNKETKDLYPRGAFSKWFPGYPNQKSDETNILIHINKDPEERNQGMHNKAPDYETPAVVCWKPPLKQ